MTMKPDSGSSKGEVEWLIVGVAGTFIFQVVSLWVLWQLAAAMADTLIQIRDLISEDHYGSTVRRTG